MLFTRTATVEFVVVVVVDIAAGRSGFGDSLKWELHKWLEYFSVVVVTNTY